MGVKNWTGAKVAADTRFLLSDIFLFLFFLRVLCGERYSCMLLMIDNYDSFTYNLVQYFGELGEVIRVFRNNKITIDQIESLQPSRIVISPGPCTPMEAGVSVETIQHFGGCLPLLGVCLGHQSLAVAFGGEVVRAERLMHGKTSKIRHDGKT